jgi:uncharacterized membrane protein
MREKIDRPKLRQQHSPVEIERKFLVANDEWRRAAVRSVSIRDGLIAVYKDRKVRVRIAGDIATVAIKGPRIGIVRPTAEVFLISWFTTGALELAGHIAGFAAVTSTILYVIHEKLWHHASRPYRRTLPTRPSSRAVPRTTLVRCRSFQQLSPGVDAWSSFRFLLARGYCANRFCFADHRMA